MLKLKKYKNNFLYKNWAKALLLIKTMKNSVKTLFFVALAAIVFLASCTKDIEPVPSLSQTEFVSQLADFVETVQGSPLKKEEASIAFNEENAKKYPHLIQVGLIAIPNSVALTSYIQLVQIKGANYTPTSAPAMATAWWTSGIAKKVNNDVIQYQIEKVIKPDQFRTGYVQFTTYAVPNGVWEDRVHLMRVHYPIKY